MNFYCFSCESLDSFPEPSYLHCKRFGTIEIENPGTQNALPWYPPVCQFEHGHMQGSKQTTIFDFLEDTQRGDKAHA